MTDTDKNPEVLDFVERLEALATKKKDIAEQEKQVKAEIKESGYETKWITYVIKQRAMEAAERELNNEERRIYEKAVGLR